MTLELESTGPLAAPGADPRHDDEGGGDAP